MPEPIKLRLTDTRIEGAGLPEAGKAQCFIWDTKTDGLAVRVSAGGRKTFIYQTRLAGKTIRLNLGTAGRGMMTVEAARAEAIRAQAAINRGDDPREIKKQRTKASEAARAKARANETPAMEAWQAYIKARTAHWSARHRADHETMVREGGEPITRGRRPGMAAEKEPGILRPLLELPLKDITRDAVTLWLEGEAKRRPTRTRLAVSLLGAFLRWCGDQPEWRDAVNQDAVARVKRGLPAPQAKDDCLQREQLRPWFDAVRQIRNPVIAAYLQVTLLTGARREEIARLQWSDVDLEWNSLTIHDKAESHGGQDGNPHHPADTVRQGAAAGFAPPWSHRASDGRWSRRQPLGIPQQIRCRVHCRAALGAQQGSGGCRAAAVDDSRPAPVLWHPVRMGGGPYWRSRADHGAQTVRNRGEALPPLPNLMR